MPRKFEFYDRVRRPKLEYPKMTGEYVSYEIKQVKKSTGPNEDDFEVEDKVIENKTNIKEYIESFANDVGIDAILRKIAMTGDASLLNQTEEIHADLSQIPEDPEEAFKLTKSVKAAFDKLDPALTQGQSPEDFIASLSEDRINKYIDGIVKAKLDKGGNDK